MRVVTLLAAAAAAASGWAGAREGERVRDMGSDAAHHDDHAPTSTPRVFMRGAAMGMLPLFDCNGTCSQYRANATAAPEDALQILADYGLNTVRLRLFGPGTFPNNSYAALPGVLAMAKRAQSAGLAISLDIFYTQWYGGGDSYYLGRRTPPPWHNLSFPELVAETYQYTRLAMQALAAQGTVPTSVQIGNEINCGLFHPWEGKPCSSGAEVCTCEGNWKNLADVVTAGSKAVRSVNPDAEIIIQYAASKELGNGDKWGDLHAFYQQLSAAGAAYDAMGLSFYQIWGAANVSNLCAMRTLAGSLPDKRIYVIETGYPYMAGGHAPSNMRPRPQFDVSPEGQVAWLRAVLFTVEHGMWGRGAGVSWWGAEYASKCSGDECAGFWDMDFTGLPVLTTQAFRPTDAQSPPPGGVVCPPL